MPQTKTITNRPDTKDSHASIGARYHVSPKFTIAPAVQFITEDSLLREFFQKDSDRNVPNDDFRLVFPADFDREFSPGTHFGLEYSYRGLSSDQNLNLHLIQLYVHGTW